MRAQSLAAGEPVKRGATVSLALTPTATIAATPLALPPVAGAVLVSGAGVWPAHSAWLAAMVPATTGGVTVMVTVLESAVHGPEMARRRK